MFNSKIKSTLLLSAVLGVSLLSACAKHTSLGEIDKQGNTLTINERTGIVTSAIAECFQQKAKSISEAASGDAIAGLEYEGMIPGTDRNKPLVRYHIFPVTSNSSIGFVKLWQSNPKDTKITDTFRECL